MNSGEGGGGGGVSEILPSYFCNVLRILVQGGDVFNTRTISHFFSLFKFFGRSLTFQKFDSNILFSFLSIQFMF